MRKAKHQGLDPKKYQYLRKEWREVEQPISVGMNRVWGEPEKHIIRKVRECSVVWEGGSH